MSSFPLFGSFVHLLLLQKSCFNSRKHFFLHFVGNFSWILLNWRLFNVQLVKTLWLIVGNLIHIRCLYQTRPSTSKWLLVRKGIILVRFLGSNWEQHNIISNSFRGNSFNELLDLLTVAAIVETVADACEVFFLVQLPYLPIYPWPAATKIISDEQWTSIRYNKLHRICRLMKGR